VAERTPDDLLTRHERQALFEDLLKRYLDASGTKLAPGLTVCGVEVDPVTDEVRRRCWHVG
jgi:hypothetical protein